MSSESQAALIEAIPFIRDITPLDLLDLPRGLFEAIPKPCNMKRSSGPGGGPIWPPVLTNVLINGLLVLHHKPHLVGKSGLDEHYNWLSSFIYRQTRGWDLTALARNTIEIKPSRPGERQMGVIRNRKQISSKVQTIGEYLKDTHWAYVTQGPKPNQRLGCNELSINAPIFGPAGSAGDHSPPIKHAPDLSRVSLEPSWLPPTPFSLPSTPNHSPYSYPGDVAEHELFDARALGYDPTAWPEFKDKVGLKRTSLPLALDYTMDPFPQPSRFKGTISLFSASIEVLFGGNPPTMEGVSPQLLTGTHQLARLDLSRAANVNPPPSTSLNSRAQQLVNTYSEAKQTYIIDLPVHLPTSAADRGYLSREVGSDFHVKGYVGLQTDSLIPPRDDEFKVVFEVWFFSGASVERAELLQTYEEAVPIRQDHSGVAGSLLAHAFATNFMAKLWGDSIEPSLGSIQDLSRYIIVQKVVPTGGTETHLMVLYTLRQTGSLEYGSIQLFSRGVSEEQSDPSAAQSPISDTDMEMGTTPRQSTSDRFAGSGGRRTDSNQHRGLGNINSRLDGAFGYSRRRQSTSSTAAGGPVRNTKVITHTLASVSPITVATSPPANLTGFPITPEASPINDTNATCRETTPGLLLGTPPITRVGYTGDTLNSTTIGRESQSDAHRPSYHQDWPTLYTSPGMGSMPGSVTHTHSAPSAWMYNSPEIARHPVNMTLTGSNYDTYHTGLHGHYTDNEHLFYYGSSVGTWS